ncbi:MAG: DNA mismatch repair endonuclease MutL [Spirochaetaceae bacterium]|jgi:DNA mismatch repair protein MutL|nr:DNA mismatch repair endonuclease MutL [Spirochaetaceae bacterium]
MAQIQVLPPEEARKIAAGEVIDRPAALVREFIDNALDAGAENIDVSIEEGGIRLVEVSDDGCGMDRDDLALCIEDHATSKITSLDDLVTTRTLGFRGEALPAAGSVAELEIVTGRNGEAWRMAVHNGAARLGKAARSPGTTVRTRFLFDYIPARKRFLKRPASEALLCRQVFLEKAAAFPDIQFRFTQDGTLKLFLPAGASLKERFAAAFKLEPSLSLLHHIEGRGEGFTFSIVLGGPGLSRLDKKLQMVFANGRRIHDWGLQQALEAGLQGGFPNNEHPVGAIFLDIDPRLVDFNIHPAKREAKFQKAGDIHHAVSTTLRAFLPGLLERRSLALPLSARPDPLLPFSPARGPRDARGTGETRGMREANPDPANLLAEEALYDYDPPGEEPGLAAAEPAPYYGRLTFIGRLWGLFILVEKDRRLYLIDQHAAHERILYERYLSGPIPAEPLLIPLAFSTETSEEDQFLSAHQDSLARLGIQLEQEAPHMWRLDSLPAGWRASDRETAEAVLALPRTGTGFVESWAASCACHTAVRDGAFLDERSALDLARAAMDIPARHCPHGRPIWVEITQEELLKGVKRL